MPKRQSSSPNRAKTGDNRKLKGKPGTASDKIDYLQVLLSQSRKQTQLLQSQLSTASPYEVDILVRQIETCKESESELEKELSDLMATSSRQEPNQPAKHSPDQSKRPRNSLGQLASKEMNNPKVSSVKSAHRRISGRAKSRPVEFWKSPSTSDGGAQSEEEQTEEEENNVLENEESSSSSEDENEFSSSANEDDTDESRTSEQLDDLSFPGDSDDEEEGNRERVVHTTISKVKAIPKYAASGKKKDKNRRLSGQMDSLASIGTPDVSSGPNRKPDSHIPGGLGTFASLQSPSPAPASSAPQSSDRKSSGRKKISSASKLEKSQVKPEITISRSQVKKVHFSPLVTKSDDTVERLIMQRLDAKEGSNVTSTRADSFPEEGLVAHAQGTKMHLLPSSRGGSKVAGMGAQLFNVASAPSLSGFIVGNLVLPPGGVKPTESVGHSTRVYTVVSGQLGSIEVALGATTTPESEPTRNFFVSPKDVFRVPPGYSYRLANNSSHTECYLTWTLIRSEI